MAVLPDPMSHGTSGIGKPTGVADSAPALVATLTLG